MSTNNDVDISKVAQATLDNMWETLKAKGQSRVDELRRAEGEGKPSAPREMDLPSWNYLDRAIATAQLAVDSIESNPRIQIAKNTGYISMEYGNLRKAAKSSRNTLTFPYDKTQNPFRLNKKAFTTSGKTYTLEDNMFVGVTKASMIAAITDDIDVPTNPGNQVAAFSMAIKKLSYKGNELTAELFNMPGKATAIPNSDFSAYIPLNLGDSRYDDRLISFGRYVDPKAVSADTIWINMKDAWQYEVVNGYRAGKASMVLDMLETTQELTVSRTFFCCIFFELLKGMPEISEYVKTHELDPNNLSEVKIWMLGNEETWLKGKRYRLKKRMDRLVADGLTGLEDFGEDFQDYDHPPGDDETWKDWSKGRTNADQLGAVIARVQVKLTKVEDRLAAIPDEIRYYEENPYTLQEFLDQQKVWLQKLKELLLIVVTLTENSAFDFSWPKFNMNIVKMMTNTIYIILMTMLDEIQRYAMQEAMEWVSTKKQEGKDAAQDEADENGYCTDPDRPSQGGGTDAYSAFGDLKLKYSTGECSGDFSGGYNVIAGDAPASEGACSSAGGTWLSPQTRCEEAGYEWLGGISLRGMVIECLPWEQLLIIVVNAIFGKDGIFKLLKGFIERMKNSIKQNRKNKGLDDIHATTDKDWLKGLAKHLKGAIDIIDWLLSLNASAFDICNTYSPGQTIKPGALDDYEMIQCQLPDGTIEEMTRAACAEAGGAEVELIKCQLSDGTIQELTRAACDAAGGLVVEDPQATSEIIMGEAGDGPSLSPNLKISGGSPSTYSTDGKLDITGMDPLGVMIFQDPGAIANFLSKGVGLSVDEAREAVEGAKRGECLKDLTGEELQNLKTIMNQAGLEV